MGLRHEPRGFVTNQWFLRDRARGSSLRDAHAQTARVTDRPLPIDPAVSATATACPGRGRDGRAPCGSGRQLHAAPSLAVEVDDDAVPRATAGGVEDAEGLEGV